MKCAFCHKEIRVDPYQGPEGMEYDVNINGIECSIRLHTECINGVLSAYLSEYTKGAEE